jgi:hypothetical protein
MVAGKRSSGRSRFKTGRGRDELQAILAASRTGAAPDPMV